MLDHVGRKMGPIWMRKFAQRVDTGLQSMHLLIGEKTLRGSKSEHIFPNLNRWNRAHILLVILFLPVLKQFASFFFLHITLYKRQRAFLYLKQYMIVYLQRKMQIQGSRIRLVPRITKPYIKCDKNDFSTSTTLCRFKGKCKYQRGQIHTSHIGD